MTLLITNDEAIELLDMARLVEALESALLEEYAGHLVQPPRQNLYLPTGFLRVGAACLPGLDVMGFKAFNGSAEIGVRYVVNLYRMSTGELMSMVDASYLTAARTGAITGVATRHLARSGPVRVGIIGSGLEAETNLAAVYAVREVVDIRVYSPRPHRREDFAERTAHRYGLRCTAVQSPEAAVDGADVVLVATNTGKGSGVTALHAALMAPGMHVNSIGSTMPDLRELEAAVFGRADTFVVDSKEAVERESGDVQAAQREGIYPDQVVELAGLVAGAEKGRIHGDAMTLFKSVGTALQDVVGALAIYEAAVAAKRGTNVGDFPVPKYS